MAAKAPFNGKESYESSAFRAGANCDGCGKRIGGLLIALPRGPEQDVKETCWFCHNVVDVSRGYGPLIETPNLLIEDTAWPTLDDGRRIVKIGNTLAFQKGEKITACLRLPLEVECEATVDGEPRIKAKCPGPYNGDFRGLWDRLRHNGRVFHQAGQEMLAWIVANAPHRTAQATFGVYADEDGRLSIPEEFFPSSLQSPYHQDLEPWIAHEAQAADWQAYLDVAGRFHDFESLPLMGLAAMAPAFYLLRDRANWPIPCLFLFSRSASTGKTTLARTFGPRLWKAPETPASTLAKDFRLNHLFDFGCGLFQVEEAEKADWETIGPTLKTAYTSPHGRMMGQVKGGQLGMERPRNRSAPVFTANTPPELDEPTLHRILGVHADEDRAPSDDDRAFFSNVEEHLKPLGPSLAKAIPETHSTLPALLKELKFYASEISKQFAGRMRDGARRPQAWALVYVGLTIWQVATRNLFIAPTVDDFVKNVVGPVEESTYKRTRSRLDNFSHFFEEYLQRNTRHTQDGSIVAGEGRKLGKGSRGGKDGWLFDKDFLQDYNRTCGDTPHLRFEDLTDHAREICKAFKVPLGELFTKEGDLKSARLPKQARCSFWPNETFAETEESSVPVSQAILNGRE